MSEDLLREASEQLREAAIAATGDTRERLYDQSNQLAELTAADRDPDHGRLARHVHDLREIGESLDGEATAHVEQAIDAIQEYREGVEGV